MQLRIVSIEMYILVILISMNRNSLIKNILLVLLSIFNFENTPLGVLTIDLE